MTTKNPYDFVPFPDGSAIERKPPSGHDTFSGISGRFECELEALSPLLVMGPEERAGTHPREAGRFQERIVERDRGLRDFYTLIPGTSLKGVVRSLFNVLMPSCVVSTNTEAFVPGHFGKCNTHDELCPACRVFGALSQDRVHRGHVNIGEAIADDPPGAREIQLVPLFGPQPSKSDRYGTHSNPAGRKFYFHHHDLSTAETQNDQERGHYVAPVKGRTEDAPGATFTFNVTFQNLAERQLAALASALTLTGDAPLDGEKERVAVRHKIGYGKPAGLGSAEIRITRAELESEPKRRYGSFRRSPDVFEQGTDALADWLAEQRAPFFASPTPEVQSLIRILRHPPDPDTAYAYPSGGWG